MVMPRAGCTGSIRSYCRTCTAVPNLYRYGTVQVAGPHLILLSYCCTELVPVPYKLPKYIWSYCRTATIHLILLSYSCTELVPYRYLKNRMHAVHLIVQLICIYIQHVFHYLTEKCFGIFFLKRFWNGCHKSCDATFGPVLVVFAERQYN